MAKYYVVYTGRDGVSRLCEDGIYKTIRAAAASAASANATNRSHGHLAGYSVVTTLDGVSVDAMTDYDAISANNG